MLDLLSTQNALHTRLVDFNLQQYLFVLQVVLGERIEVAYANTFDTAEFKRNVPSEDEEDYLAKLRRDAENMMDTQECVQLRDELESLYNSDIQAKATNFKGYRFSGEDVQKLLADLLHDRTSDLSEASVRDILALLKMMYENGSLDSGDTFQRHWVTLPKKYDCICPNCNHEIYLVEGVDNRCNHCSHIIRWSEEEQRFYPNPDKL
jgi:hypothetical protein